MKMDHMEYYLKYIRGKDQEVIEVDQDVENLRKEAKAWASCCRYKYKICNVYESNQMM